jgi:hypothetical protein
MYAELPDDTNCFETSYVTRTDDSLLDLCEIYFVHHSGFKLIGFLTTLYDVLTA